MNFDRIDFKKQCSFLKRFRELYSIVFRGKEHQEKASLRNIHQISIEKIVDRVQEELVHIEKVQEELLKKKGAKTFISRYIAPVVQPMHSFVDFVHNGETEERAIQSVEMAYFYSHSVEDKVVSLVCSHIREILMEDISFFTVYPKEIEGTLSFDGGKKIKKIESKVLPFIKRLEELLDTIPISKKIVDVFMWRQEMDRRRQSIYDEGLHIVGVLSESLKDT